jgi:HD superfamily phosphohydrolase
MPAYARELEVAPSRAAAQLISELNDLCAEYLDPQIRRLQDGEVYPRPKVVNDALWGSIRLAPWEVAILDSYLLQRLRFLRQLGVAHLVFPAAGHSRLEHSLGTLHQMAALIDSLERGSGQAGEQIVGDGTAKLLRIAAMMHDCGHTLMSHVSEPLVEELPGMADLRKWAKKKWVARHLPSTSEAIAVVLITSPAFQELLSIPSAGADFIDNVKLATEQIAGFVVGGPVLPEKAFLSLLMNGPHDVDKLDYMPRDCMMAGVPCGVDVRRVIETIRCFDVPVEKMPKSYAAWAKTSSETVKVLALSSSGARTLHEIATTRTILYEKIYYHQKVRALETMVRRSLDKRRITGIKEWLDLTDDHFLFGRDKSCVDIRRRNLLKRAFVISTPKEMEDPAKDDECQAGWRRLTENAELKQFRAAIRKSALAIAEVLGMGVEALQAQPPELDFPKTKDTPLDQSAFVGDSVDGFHLATAVLSAQRPQAGRWAASQTVYVFAPEAAVLPVFLAARSVLYRDYGLDYGAEAYLSTRLDPDAIRSAEKKLKNSGKYEVAGIRPLAPLRLQTHKAAMLETFLKSAWPRLENLAHKFGQYQTQGSGPLSPASIAAFLRQFGEDRLARPALRMLEAVHFKDRAYFVAALKSRMEAALQSGDVSCVCPLGGTGDSSAFLSYLMNDLPLALRRPVKQLEIALEGRGIERILLWDDFCGAAGHAETAICQWLGAKDHPLKEQLVSPLNKQRRKAFRRANIVMTFALARRTGLAKLERLGKRLGLPNLTTLKPSEIIPEASSLFKSNAIIRDKNERKELKRFLQRETRKMMEYKLARSDDRWTTQKLEERLLGYGNGAHLLVFFYNVPTVTLTALWAPEDAPGPDDLWKPLFRRRPKPALVTPVISKLSE